MNRKLIWGVSFILALTLCSALCAQQTATTTSKTAPLTLTSQEKNISKSVEAMLKAFHLSKKPTDEVLSERAFDLYFKSLDPWKTYFLASDIAEFGQKKKEIGAMVTSGNIGYAFDIFNHYVKRGDERLETLYEILEGPIDLDTNEEMVIDPKLLEYPKTREEARKRLEQRVKYELLNQKAELIDRAEKKVEEEAKKAEKENRAVSPVPPAVTDIDTLKRKLRRRYFFSNQNVHQWTNHEVLERFLTAVANAYDPHTSYMSPSTFENFMIQMRLNLDGIGATLQSSDGIVLIHKLVPNGPAAKSTLLEEKEYIVAVGQGTEGPMLDIYGLKLDDVVSKIRGKGGTQVRLEVIPQNASEHYGDFKDGKAGKPESRIVTLTRERVNLEESAAKSQIFEVGLKPDQTPYKIGIINLPSFYSDTEALRRGVEGRSTSRDVRNILRQFTEEGVDTVVMDLRFNGGGSLPEVVRVTGLFIETGNVVQTKEIGRPISSLDDNDPSVEWTGPFIVLVNKFSASASEILAGAIKEYNRGLIIGDSKTHGKGSVQELKEIGDALFRGTPNPPNLGVLKLTVSGYYLPNGISPQQRGVESDILLPSLTDCLDEYSEKDLDYPLSFEDIPKNKSYPNFPYVNELILRGLREKSEDRVQKNGEFKKVLRDIQTTNDLKQRKTRTLNEKKFFDEHDRLKAERQETEKIEEATSSDNKIVRDYYLDEVMSIAIDWLSELAKLGVKFPVEKSVIKQRNMGMSLFN